MHPLDFYEHDVLRNIPAHFSKQGEIIINEEAQFTKVAEPIKEIPVYDGGYYYYDEVISSIRRLNPGASITDSKWYRDSVSASIHKYISPKRAAEVLSISENEILELIDNEYIHAYTFDPQNKNSKIVLLMDDLKELARHPYRSFLSTTPLPSDSNAISNRF